MDRAQARGILGLSPSFTPEELKKAYRSKATASHPDSNAGKGNPEEFLRVKEAYDFLKQSKRPSAPGQSIRSNWTSRSLRDVFKPIFVPLGTALCGGHVDVHFSRTIICETCNGHGSLTPEDSSITQCKVCNGSGRSLSASGKNAFITTICENCAGRGWYSPNGCSDCGGRGWLKVPEDVTRIYIHPNTLPGTHIIITGGGNHGIPPGDLVVSVSFEPNPSYIVDGLNIVHRIEVDALIAMVGGSVSVVLPDGSSVPVIIKPGTKNRDRKILRGKGFKTSMGQGDFVCSVDLSIPKDLSSQDVADIKKILQRRTQ